MSNRNRGLLLMAAGVVLALVSLGADPLGLGGYPGFGWKQILGTLVGIGMAGFGLGALRR